MKILIIEDEAKTAAYLKQGLEEQGFSVLTSGDGEEGLQLALATKFDLIILDVMLPSREGWSIIAELRKAGRDTLTLFLTARDELDDRIRGLDLGADAYLVKPFAFAELLAQIRSLVRRGTKGSGQDLLQVADLSIDRIHQVAIRNGVRLELSPREFSLLALLAARKGEILSRTEISEKVWNLHFDPGTNTLEVHIRRLRSKVDDPWPQKLIKTIRGVGYTIEEPA